MKLEIEGCTVKENRDLKNYTTFRIGGSAKIFVEPESVRGVSAAVRTLSGNFKILGNGSNVLIPDGGVDVPVIHIGKAMSKLEIRDNVIFAEAGAPLPSAARLAGENALSGLEFASGIPGSVGGAVRMNAGAYGGEMKDVVSRIIYVTREGEIKEMSAEDAHFGYRESVFKESCAVICGVEFTLKKGNKEEIEEKMHELSRKRREKQPLDYPSAGSAFKRPEGGYAAALIDAVGLKGFSVGGAAVSEKHAGFIINKGSATADDVLKLIKAVQKRVMETNGVALTPEIEIW